MIAGQRHDFALTVDGEDINAAEGCHISPLARSDFDAVRAASLYREAKIYLEVLPG
ncbi:MAG TPA: hypothetical protein VEC93_00780 [Anaerolineae bacterium]|nr:hypothetical protein [Anaerolineae bacterium]